MCGGLLFWGISGGAGFAQQPARPMPADDPNVAILRQGAELPAALYESRLLARALQLTPDQMRRMREVRRQEAMAMQAARRKVADCRRLLNDAIYGEETSESIVEQRARELAAAEADLTQLRARMQYRVRAILTAEQVRAFNELRADPRRTLERRQTERAAPGQPALPPTP
ncbi:MAG: hypothetical protein CFK52_06795 [Chloracidobacterium sp. CP2_5A]|nr:MAG: hypothetical protein CFK52_06795 [Chloracidobacterium sp. CP2_5A]